jgi:hypothetical protein
MTPYDFLYLRVERQRSRLGFLSLNLGYLVSTLSGSASVSR